MDGIWKSNLGKVFLGGCGTQLGMAFAFVALAGTLMLCFICVLSSVLSVAIMQEITRPPTYVVAEAAPETPSNNEEVEILRAEIESLVSQVESLQANEPVVPAPAVAPAPLPKPFAIAYKSGVNLRSGPGADYSRIGVLPVGSRYEIVGRNGDSSWWLISTPDGLAWVRADLVVAYDLNDEIPVLTIPALLVLPETGNKEPAPLSTPVPNTAPNLPVGTPTATAAESRVFVEDTPGYKKLREQLSAPPASASFSPKGDQIAITEGIKLYLAASDSSGGRILLADDGILAPAGGVLWSPNGDYIAFVVERKQGAGPRRSVGLARLSDESIFFLQTPDNLIGDAPRWTQDGRLLINVHPGEPADGTTYIYETSGRGQVASGTYVLSGSHDGQKWLPWRPGRTWQAGVSERPDTYYSD